MNLIVSSKRPFSILALVCTAVFLSSNLSAAELSMWARESSADAAKLMIAQWNKSHDDKITLTSIPNTQIITKFATASQTGDAPDLLSFDLIYMPDFMKAGMLTELTEQLNTDANYKNHVQAYKDIATYEKRLYGVGFTPDVSVLAWNKALFRKAGLDPEKGPTSIDEIYEMAKKISELDKDTYGFYFSGSCPGCNIFVTSPLMVAGGAKILPRSGEDTALEGEAIPYTLNMYKKMWDEGMIPASAEVDTGANFVAAFTKGNIGMTGTGGFLISLMERENPNFEYGLTLLPGIKQGEVSGFVGGDVIAIPANGKNEEIARQFVTWVLSDDAQLNGLAKNALLPTRTDLATSEYITNPKVLVTAEALKAGYVPWVYHFADMVNADSSPWNVMLQAAIFDGDVERAIADAREEMLSIAGK